MCNSFDCFKYVGGLCGIHEWTTAVDRMKPYLKRRGVDGKRLCRRMGSIERRKSNKTDHVFAKCRKLHSSDNDGGQVAIGGGWLVQSREAMPVNSVVFLRWIMSCPQSVYLN